MKKRGALIKLFKYVKREIAPIIICLILSIASVVLAVYATTVLRTFTNLINDAATQAAQTSLTMAEVLDFKEVSRLCMFLVGMYAGSIVLGFLQSFLMAGVIQRVSYRLRKDISQKINALPLNYFDTRKTGDIMSRVTNDVDTVAQSLSSAVSTTVTSVVQLILVAVIMFITSWQMGLTTLVSVPLSAVAAMIVMKVSHKHFKRQQKVLGELNGKAEEAYSGLATIHAFGQEEKFIKDFDKMNAQLKKAMFKANSLSQFTHPISTFINKLGYVAVCVVGGILVSGGGVDLGALAAFLIYVNLFQQPLSQLAQTMNVFQQASAAADRVFEFLEEEEQDDESSKTAHIANATGKVEFRNVKFGYTEDKVIIKDFNAVIQPGQKVAIVGPTGAGKTTLVNLLMRFYEINNGEILIDGVSIKDMPREKVRSLFSMVLQDTWLFEGTMRENIAYTTGANEEEVQRAVEKAGLSHFVNGLPEGLDTRLDGDSLSAGQKQLLTIARAMVQNSPMMILDEATSNVDTSTEELIQEAMDALSKDKTSFVIAHRLSTIKNADLILVLKDGDIIEQGNHEKLLKQNGFYADLYNSQFAA